MEQETKRQRYMRLLGLINNAYKDGDHPPFTSSEKRDFGRILADNMTPEEFDLNIQEIGDVWYDISETYNNLNDFDLTLEFVGDDDCENVDDWIKKNGLPLPDRDDMVDHILSTINRTDYINEYHGDVLDLLPGQCEFNLTDEELIHLFEVHVKEPEEDKKKVICDAAIRCGCTDADCFHATPHYYDDSCNQTNCDTHEIRVKCIPVEEEQ